MIIEVAFGFQRSEASRKNMGDGFFGGRLPRRSGDSNQGLAPDSPHCGGERLQRYERVFNGQQPDSCRDNDATDLCARLPLRLPFPERRLHNRGRRGARL